MPERAREAALNCSCGSAQPSFGKVTGVGQRGTLLLEACGSTGALLKLPGIAVPRRGVVFVAPFQSHAGSLAIG